MMDRRFGDELGRPGIVAECICATLSDGHTVDADGRRSRRLEVQWAVAEQTDANSISAAETHSELPNL